LFSSDEQQKDEYIVYSSLTKITQDEAIKIKTSHPRSSNLCTAFLNEINLDRCWSKFEIEQLLYAIPKSSINNKFIEWINTTMNMEIDPCQLIYSNSIYIKKEKLLEKCHPISQVYQEFLNYCHPVLFNHMEKMDFHEVAFHKIVQGTKHFHHILFDGSTDCITDNSNLKCAIKKFVGEHNETPRNNENVELNHRLREIQAMVLFSNGNIHSAEKDLVIDELSFIILYIPETNQILYIDKTELNEALREGTWRKIQYTSIDQTKKEISRISNEGTNLIAKQVCINHSSDYIVGTNSLALIKSMMEQKSSQIEPYNYTEDDEVIEVVGQNLFDKAKSYIALHVNIKDQVKFQVDHTNIYDKFAILVLHNHRAIGYISAKRNKDVNYYLHLNPNLEAEVYEFDKGGKTSFKVLIKSVINKPDKESPGDKLDKYIYESIIDKSKKRFNLLCHKINSFDHIKLENRINSLLISCVIGLIQGARELSPIYFQPLQKTMLNKFFGPKTATDIENLTDGDFIDEIDKNIIENSCCYDDDIGFFWKDTITRVKERNQKEIITQMVETYIHLLHQIRDAIIVSRQKQKSEEMIINSTIQIIEKNIYQKLLFCAIQE